MSLEQTLQTAITHHKAGELEDAEQLYRSILTEKPNHPDANHNLGVLLKQGDQAEIALPFYKTALESNPNQGQFWISYIDNLMHLQQYEAAQNVLNQGRTKGLKGDAVDQLEDRLNTKAESSPEPVDTQPKKGLKTLHKGQMNKKNQSGPTQAQVDSVISLYSQGQVQEALDVSEILIKDHPNVPLLYNISGACYMALGQLDAAVKSYEQALAIKPDYTEALNNLGNTLKELGQLEAAVKCYEQALAIKPYYAEAHSNLGVTLQELNQLEAAVKSYEQALAIKPDYAEAHNNLGNTLQGLGQLEAAVKCYEQALAIKPDYAEAHFNLGITLHDLGQLDAAIKSYEKALAIKPDHAEAHSNLGITLHELNQLDAAVKRYEQALAIKPDYAEAHYNLGITLHELNQLDAAVKRYEQALAIKPDYAEALNNLGNTLHELGQMGAAVKCYEQALAMKPDFAEAKWNLSLTQLVTGNFKTGWLNYESRWKKKNFEAERRYPQPFWDGSSLVCKTLFLYPEQGVGDLIIFIRYVKVLSTKTTKIIVECPKSLHRLLSTIPEINVLVTKEDTLPDFDFYAPLLSLPGILNTTLQTIPVNIPYLFADDHIVSPIITQPKVLNIGVVWAGNPMQQDDKKRSVNLSFFSAIADIPNTKLYSLQVGDRRDDLNQEYFTNNIIDLGEYLNDYADTATVIKQLDLIITVCTSVAHLAGAMGKPVWVLLSSSAYWLWLLERDDSPWYPTMRLFRQQERGNWTTVFNEVYQALKHTQ